MRQVAFSQVAIDRGGSFPGRSCPVAAVRVAVVQVTVALEPNDML